MKLNELEYKNIIGQGYFCFVKKYKDRINNRTIAIKQLKNEHLTNEDYKRRFLREIRMTRNLKHSDNVIDIVGEGIAGEYWYAMPFADSNLYNYIRINNTSLDLEERLHLIDQIIEAIKSAHDIDIIHRDLSPQNILLFISEEIVKVKVSDFGLGKDLESLSKLTRVEAEGYGQNFYVAPEQFENLNSSSKKSDIYSLGKIIYFIMTGKVPSIINQCELSVIINKCIKENPNDRYGSIDDLIQDYNNLKKLILGSNINLDKLTVLGYLHARNSVDWLEFHKVATRAKIDRHVFDDYLSPSVDLLLRENNLKNYYNIVGDSIEEFVNILISKIGECGSMVGWPFSYTKYFGELLNLIYEEVGIDEVKLKCLKELWHVGVEQNQFRVQDIVKDIIQSGNIPESIVYSFADYIYKSTEDISISPSNYKSIQKPIKNALGI